MKVRELVKARGYTMREVANKMGITPSSLSQNLMRTPSTSTLQKIAHIIGCSVGDFFIDEMEMPLVLVRHDKTMVVRKKEELPEALSELGLSDWIEK